MLSRVRAIVGAGIPVMGHIGLTPQSATMLGGFKAQGRTAEKALALLEDARALEAAGCFSLVLEAVPAPVAARITERLAIPTIGIGAGADCDGQVLVWHDLLGLYEGRAAALRQALRRARGDDRGRGRALRRRRARAPFPEEPHVRDARRGARRLRGGGSGGRDAGGVGARVRGGRNGKRVPPDRAGETPFLADPSRGDTRFPIHVPLVRQPPAASGDPERAVGQEARAEVRRDAEQRERRAEVVALAVRRSRAGARAPPAARRLDAFRDDVEPEATTRSRTIASTNDVVDVPVRQAADERAARS